MGAYRAPLGRKRFEPRFLGGTSTVSKEAAATETHCLRAGRFKASVAEQPIGSTPEQSSMAHSLAGLSEPSPSETKGPALSQPLPYA